LWRKRGHFKQDIGRSKGGLTSKIHAVVDALGNPVRILLTAGNVNDIVPAPILLEGLLGEKLLADRAYDANKLIEFAIQQQMEVIIPPTAHREDRRCVQPAA
jgi:transposase